MMRRKMDYSNGIIYKLCCNDAHIDTIFLGSTTNFRSKKSTIKKQVNDPNNKEYNSYQSKFIRDHGGWENWQMVLVEYYNAIDFRDLEKRQYYWYERIGTYNNPNKLLPKVLSKSKTKVKSKTN